MEAGSGLEARITIDVLATERHLEREREELRALLTRSLPRIPSRYFYDAKGSRLFDEITRLPEYYLTRAEAAILERHAGRIVEGTGAAELVELGSGSSTKTRILLDAMAHARRLRRYVPFDVSETAVRAAARELAERYPGLTIHGVVGEFDRHLGHIPPGERRLVLLIGSTIGNFDLPEAAALLKKIARPMATGDFFLLGVDLVKDVHVLEAAYNDSQGVTARFNLNILRVVNATFGADFDVEGWTHRAFYNTERDWIEMRLVARHSQRVRLDDLDLELEFAAGDEILTEISSKYRRSVVDDLLTECGFAIQSWITDEDGLFALALARRVD